MLENAVFSTFNQMFGGSSQLPTMLSELCSTIWFDYRAFGSSGELGRLDYQPLLGEGRPGARFSAGEWYGGSVYWPGPVILDRARLPRNPVWSKQNGLTGPLITRSFEKRAPGPLWSRRGKLNTSCFEWKANFHNWNIILNDNYLFLFSLWTANLEKQLLQI